MSALGVRDFFFVIRNVSGEEGSEAFGIVAPVAVQFAGRTEPGHELCARGGHAIPGGVSGQGVEGARSVRHDKDVIAFFQSGQGGEGNADFGDHAGNDELFFARGLDCLDEVFVVPGIDVTVPGDVGSIVEG